MDKMTGFLYTALCMCMLCLSSAFGEEVQANFTVDGALNDQQLYVLGYQMAFEAGSGKSLAGTTDRLKIDRIRSLILAQATGYPEDVSVDQLDANKYQVVQPPSSRTRTSATIRGRQNS